MPKIDVVKKNVSFEKLVKQNNTSTVLKNEYLIPDTHPDAEKILIIDPKATIINKEILSDKILIGGKIEYNVIYIPREDNCPVNSVEYSEEFTSYLEISNNSGKIRCDANFEIEHMKFRVMNERKIEVECVIRTNYDVYLSSDFDFVEGINGDKSLELLNKKTKINSIVYDKELDIVSKLIMRVPMDKPEISKILKASLTLHKKEVKLGENKIYLGCYCKIVILYMDNDNSNIYSIEDDMYISKEEDMDGIFQEMIPIVSYEIENKDITFESDDLGESRVINLEVLVKSNLKIFFDEEVSTVDDAYSTKYMLDINKNRYDLGMLKGIQTIESIIRDNINLKEDQERPESIIFTTGKVIINEKNITINKLTIEGVINAEVLYKSSGENISYSAINGTIPFSSSIDIAGINGDMKSIVLCSIENIEGTIESNNIALKITLSISAKVFSEESKVFISDVLESDEDIKDKKSSITIYVVGKGDTLWEIAKKFNSTVDAITKINNIDNADMIYPGEKILIPGRAIF